MNSRFDNPGPAMKHTTTQNLYAYWNAMRGARLAPRRFEIEPAQIADILPDTFILERVDFETYPFSVSQAPASASILAPSCGAPISSTRGPTRTTSACRGC